MVNLAILLKLQLYHSSHKMVRDLGAGIWVQKTTGGRTQAGPCLISITKNTKENQERLVDSNSTHGNSPEKQSAR
jgi:hypothetical protein